jgi:hypothetical protein
MNKIYVSEYKGEGSFPDYKSHFVIVTAADSIETCREWVKDIIGIDVEPTWLMNSEYPTLYTSDSYKPLPKQAKILYNGNFHLKIK